MDPKKVGSKKSYDPKTKVKNNVGPKNLWVQKKFGVQKILSPTNFWYDDLVLKLGSKKKNTKSIFKVWSKFSQ